MKFLLILGMIVAAMYLLSDGSKASTEFSSYKELYQRIDSQGASLEEVKRGSLMLAQHYCSNKEYLIDIGLSPVVCKQGIAALQTSCKEKIFKNAPSNFSDEAVLSNYARQYVSCLGIPTEYSKPLLTEA